MNKQILRWTVVLMLTFTSLPLTAQISDHLLPHFGFMRETVALAPESAANPQFDYLNYNALHIGTYYAIGHINDVFSYGVDAAVQGGIFPQQINGQLKIDGIVQVPVYAMVRLGANATPYNTQRVGMAVGIGGTLGNFGFRQSQSQKLKSTFILPDAVFEVTFMSGGNPLTGRLHLGLNQSVFNTRIVDNAGDVLSESPFLFNGFGWGLIYGF